MAKHRTSDYLNFSTKKRLFNHISQNICFLSPKSLPLYKLCEYENNLAFKSIPLLDLSLIEMTQRAVSMRLILKHKPMIWRTEINTNVQRMGDKGRTGGHATRWLCFPGGKHTAWSLQEGISPKSPELLCKERTHRRRFDSPTLQNLFTDRSVFSLRSQHFSGQHILEVLHVSECRSSKKQNE